jgi:uncharacterized NAD(P)/FAD-binding protein YdhS
MQKIGIIGGGFCGTMTAIQLIEQSSKPIEIILIQKAERLNTGIAYDPYSDKHLLNVVAEKMSAFPDKPLHFLEWVLRQTEFEQADKNLIAQSYLPRRLYGNYLRDNWKEAQTKAKEKRIKISSIEASVMDLDLRETGVHLSLEGKEGLKVDRCVIATGNALPANPVITHPDFYLSPRYYQDPWHAASVQLISDKRPVLILGNGLTMVDTVFGLLERGYKGIIYSLSPHGFNILPHRHGGTPYPRVLEEMREPMTLLESVSLVNKHVKALRKLGISAEPVIDALRPYTQNIWQSWSDKDKALFMRRLRHLWGVARHRIPLHSHDRIQQLRIEGKLVIKSGKILALEEKGSLVMARYYDKKEKRIQVLEVCRVINCTGPETRLANLKDSFLNKCLTKGLLRQDPLQLGIRTDTRTFRILDEKNLPHTALYTLGVLLKGELWESTAVRELSRQAQQLAAQLLETP